MDPNEYSWKRPDPEPQPRQEKPRRPQFRFKPALIPIAVVLLLIRYHNAWETVCCVDFRIKIQMAVYPAENAGLQSHKRVRYRV